MNPQPLFAMPLRQLLVAAIVAIVTPAPTLAGPADPLATPPATAGKFVERPASAETLKQLRTGGFVLYMRHGNTDNSRADRVPSIDLADCATQRPLTEEGRQVAARVGAAIRKARIPIGEILSSPLCRAKETTEAAFPGLQYRVDDGLMYVSNLTDTQKAPIIANTRQLLSSPVGGGTNRLLVAHAPNLMDLIGYFPREGTLVIFRPDESGGFDYVASIPPALWPELQR